MSGVTEERSNVSYGVSRPQDPAFKLFGRTIPMVSDVGYKGKMENKLLEEASVILSVEASSCFQDEGDDEAPESDDESVGASVPDELRSSSGSHDGCEEEKPNEGIRTTILENSGTGVALIAGTEIASESWNNDNKKKKKNNEEMQKKDEDGEGQAAAHKELKKPDKAVACPRCESLDTKFCYFNNYNVNQPRHFCKSCQRYWTAGGALRNVPVGAGRRKNKHSATVSVSAHQQQQRGGLFSEGLAAVRGDPPDAAHQLSRQLNMVSSPSNLHIVSSLDVTALDSSSSSTILNFGQESPPSENMGATSFNLHRSQAIQAQGKRGCTSFDKEASSCTVLDMESKAPSEKLHAQGKNGICHASEKVDVGESACRSSAIAQIVHHTESKIDPVVAPTEVPENSFSWSAPPPFALVGGPWQYANNLGCWSAHPASSALSPNSHSSNGNPSQAFASANHPLWNPLASVWAGIPWPLMQSAMWGLPPWGAAWAMPWAPSATATTNQVPQNQVPQTGTSNQALQSPVLGKHTREHADPEREKGGSLWVPKTLRIDDPEEAARSSIWTTLGLANKQESITSGGVFRAFQPKEESKEVDDLCVQAHHSNPAAMTRSMAFQESK